MTTYKSQLFSFTKIIMILVSALLLIGVIVALIHANELSLPAPWDKIKEYALKGEYDSGCYTKIVLNRVKSIQFGLAYCVDRSLAICRTTENGKKTSLARGYVNGKVIYVFVDQSSQAQGYISETDACNIAFSWFREFVSEIVI